jgi:uncharacterized GH25 family protein
MISVTLGRKWARELSTALPCPPFFVRTAAVALAVLVMRPALGHEFWIEPSNYAPDVGATVQVSVFVGDSLVGDDVPRIDEWFERFEIIDSKGTRTIEGVPGDIPAGTTPSLRAGSSTVLYQSTPAHDEQDAKKFLIYLGKQGLEHIVEARRLAGNTESPAREMYVRMAKAYIRADSLPVAALPAALGLPAEIHQVRRATLTSPAVFRVLRSGQPVRNVLVSVRHIDTANQPISARSDAAGEVAFSLDKSGQWLISGVIMERAPSGSGIAEWISYWMSLGFSR